MTAIHGNRFNLRTNHTPNSPDGSRSSTVASFGLLKVFCLCMVTALVLVTGSYLWDSSSSDDQTAVKSIANGNITTANRGKRGFYASTAHVIELGSAAEYASALADPTPLLIAYYATWCGHCRKFAPIFTKIASKTNTGSGMPINANSTRSIVRFYALDCVAHHSLCEMQKIKFYPTVLGLHFEDKAVTLHGNEKSIIAYLEAHRIESAGDGASAVAVDGYLHNTSLAYHLSPPSAGMLTLNEMLTSWCYFLAQELPKEITQSQADVLRTITSVLQGSVPKGETEVHALLTGVKEILYKYSKASMLPSRKISELVQARIPWMSLKKAHLKAQHSSKTVISLPDLRWRVCGQPHSADEKVNQKTIAAGHRDSSKGYTCGLWMLFHFITVRGESVQLSFPSNATSAAQSQAVQVMETIHGFMFHFFRCDECRGHFLHYYEACWFDRCQVQSWEDLQFWLLRLHNLVNLRIAYENAFPQAQANVRQGVVDMSRRALWPSVAHCPQCYGSMDAHVERFLANNTSTDMEEAVKEFVSEAFHKPSTLAFLHSVY